RSSPLLMTSTSWALSIKSVWRSVAPCTSSPVSASRSHPTSPPCSAPLTPPLPSLSIPSPPLATFPSTLSLSHPPARQIAQTQRPPQRSPLPKLRLILSSSRLSHTLPCPFNTPTSSSDSPLYLGSTSSAAPFLPTSR